MIFQIKKLSLKKKNIFKIKDRNGGVKKWEDRKHLVLPRVCLVGGVEKWEGGRLFCLVEENSRRIKNVVYINWLLYLCYIIRKK